MRRLRLPLRLHILAPFLILFGALALALAFAVGRSSQDLVDRTVSASFVGSAEAALQDLRRLTETARAAAEALAADPIVRTAAGEERERSLQALATTLRSVPGISAAYVGWPNGDFVLLRPIGRHAQSLAAPAGAAWLVQWSGAAGNRFDFLDRSLRRIASRVPPDPAFDPRTRPWFVEASASPATIVTAPYIFFTTREPGVTAARRAPSGAVAGVDVALWDISERLPKGRPVPSAVAAIVDAAGGILAYSDMAHLQRMFEQASGSGDPQKDEALPPASATGSDIVAALARRSRGNRQRFYGPLVIAGVEWQTIVAPMNGHGASFVMAARTDELGDGAANERTALMKIIGVALLLAAPVVWLTANAIARPVEKFAGQVERIARLDFGSSPSAPTRVAELAVLDEAIGRLRFSLHDRIKERDCLYRVLELTTDTSRPTAEICAEVARLLPESMADDAAAVARLVLDGHEYASAGWQPPAAALRASIAGQAGEAGFVEVGYRERPADRPGGEGPFAKEERLFLDAVAAHLAHMVHSRRIAAALTQSERLGAVGRLTGGVAHDFNNLLTVILGNSELLRERLAGQERLRALADVTVRAAERGAELTQSLLAFSRRQTLEPKRVDVDRLLAGMDGLLRRTLPEAIEFRRLPGDHPLNAMVDPAQLESAILNLCINARDAMPEGGRLSVRTRNITEREAQKLSGQGMLLAFWLK
ncbi:MAG: hypothetical protein KIT16_17605 [Rhodospirillaceae bacterium]|nr:hypothetical protein [Rhodospirillaceae bacterium]